MRFLMAGGIALAFAVTPALAQECTEDMVMERQQQLATLINADPSRAPDLERYIAEVEAEYGGEPTQEQACEAMDKLIAKFNEGG